MLHPHKPTTAKEASQTHRMDGLQPCIHKPKFLKYMNKRSLLLRKLTQLYGVSAAPTSISECTQLL